MAKYLDLNGLKKFKDYLYKDFEKAKDSEVDSIFDGESDISNDIVTIRNLAYYHNKLVNDILDGGEINLAVQDVVSDALDLKVDEDGNEVKSEIYEKVEVIIDEKMKWKSEFPD